jgi:uncharacterized damage-inducible protein DinB
MLAEQFRALARYNRWVNCRVAAAVGALDDAAYRADRGLVFRSIHGTLNHVLVADRIWMHRLNGELEGPLPAALDAILDEDRGLLVAAREREDRRLLTYAEGLDEAAASACVTYGNRAGSTFTQPLAATLAHHFNHQTHHRGQIHAALTGLGEPSPAWDLVYYLRQAK